MESGIHNLQSLFAQLGLGHSTTEINAFINAHKPLPDHIALHQASFWTESQAAFLKEVIDQDADWTDVVDQLNVMLRNQPDQIR